MAGLSVHTKLVLGPRRARPSLPPRPRPPHQLRAGMGVGMEGGGGGGRVWALSAVVRHLLASPVRRAGDLFCNSLEGTASCARR